MARIVHNSTSVLYNGMNDFFSFLEIFGLSRSLIALPVLQPLHLQGPYLSYGQQNSVLPLLSLQTDKILVDSKKLLLIVINSKLHDLVLYTINFY